MLRKLVKIFGLHLAILVGSIGLLIGFPSSNVFGQTQEQSICTANYLTPLNISITLFENPRVGGKTEVTFTVRANTADFFKAYPGTESATAWLEIWWTNPWGSYMEAKQAVRIPVV